MNIGKGWHAACKKAGLIGPKAKAEALGGRIAASTVIRIEAGIVSPSSKFIASAARLFPKAVVVGKGGLFEVAVDKRAAA